jgi:dihydrofolate reductase
MANKIFCDIAISADGYVAGPGQTAEKPFGDGPADRLHAWMFDTPDENKAEIEQVAGAGAFVMGRNMFGPGRGEWELSWKAGGAVTRLTTHLCSCSPTTPASR